MSVFLLEGVCLVILAEGVCTSCPLVALVCLGSGWPHRLHFPGSWCGLEGGRSQVMSPGISSSPALHLLLLCPTSVLPLLVSGHLTSTHLASQLYNPRPSVSSLCANY